MSAHARGWLIPAGLALAVVLLFAGSWDNAFVNWDDGTHIVHNPVVLEPGAHSAFDRLTTPKLGYPIALPVLIYGWIWSLSHEPWLFHGLSAAVHALNVVLLFVLLRGQLARTQDNSGLPWVALASAWAFAAHPIVVEPVAWATGLKDLLVGTGCLLAVLAIARGPAMLGGALIAFASKPSGGLMGLALPAFCIDADRRAELQRPAVWASMVAVALGGLALLAFTSTHEVEAARTSAHVDFSVGRILAAAGLQVEHLAIPASLSPRYPAASATRVHQLLGAAAIVGIGALAWRWWRDRDVRLGWLALGVAVYLPASNLVPLNRFMADSYMYVPWMATVACIGLSAAPWLHRLQARAAARARALAGLVLLAWSALTVLQVESWSSTLRLWEMAPERYPNDGESIYRYGDALNREGERQAELGLYLKHLNALENAPRIPAELPAWLAYEGRHAEAQAWFERAFASEVEQDDALYRLYASYVGSHPQGHAPKHDAALLHCLGVLTATGDLSKLNDSQRSVLVNHARRLGAPELAAGLGG